MQHAFTSNTVHKHVNNQWITTAKSKCDLKCNKNVKIKWITDNNLSNNELIVWYKKRLSCKEIVLLNSSSLTEEKINSSIILKWIHGAYTKLKMTLIKISL